ncbi:MAG TPA: hypothetical protein VK066_13265 [Chloroflexota bacterium]|nr:hypothetical protein [Chloroflexota bacterium]
MQEYAERMLADPNTGPELRRACEAMIREEESRARAAFPAHPETEDERHITRGVVIGFLTLMVILITTLALVPADNPVSHSLGFTLFAYGTSIAAGVLAAHL